MRTTVLEPISRTVPQELRDVTIQPDVTATAIAVERDRYRQALFLPTDQLREFARDQLIDELSRHAEASREAARTRLLAWLELDPEEARVLGRLFDEAAERLPDAQRDRRFEAERDALLHGLSFRQFQQLARAIPWLRSSLGLTVLGSDPALRDDHAA